MFIGTASTACSIRPMCHGPGVQVVASVPCAGPVPPPSIVVTPECSASSICCGQMKWMWLSNPPAVRIRPSPAITSVPGPMTMVTPGWVSGLPALPIRAIRPSRSPTSALIDAGPVHDQRVGDDGVDRALRPRRLALAHAVADHLAAAELHLLAVDGEVPLHLDDELGVGQPHPVAGGRPVHVGIGGAGDAGGHGRDLSERHAEGDDAGLVPGVGGRIGIGPTPGLTGFRRDGTVPPPRRRRRPGRGRRGNALQNGGLRGRALRGRDFRVGRDAGRARRVPGARADELRQLPHAAGPGGARTWRWSSPAGRPDRHEPDARHRLPPNITPAGAIGQWSDAELARRRSARASAPTAA